MSSGGGNPARFRRLSGPIKLRVGTRGSTLATTQTGQVVDALASSGGGDFEIVIVKTPGGARPGEPAGDKARFVRELQFALMRGEIDIAVHSAKDLPSDSELARDLPGELRIVAVPPRASALDALCGAGSLDSLADGAHVGTSSLRRRSQLLAARPDLRISPLHGNVDTRLAKLRDGDWDAIVLAAAGLDRLGLSDRISSTLPQLTPSAGQGCLALEVRAEDHETAEIVASVDDRSSHACLIAERTWVDRIGASCNTPAGAHAQIEGDEITMAAYAGLPDGSHWIKDLLAGPANDPVALGEQIAKRMLTAGIDEILRQSEERAGEFTV